MRPQEAFGKSLRELRAAKKISQDKLAFEVSLDRTYISLLERGLRQPSLTTILLLSKALEISPSELMNDVVKRLGKDVVTRKKHETR